MKSIPIRLSLLLAIATLFSCATGGPPTAGQYAMGSDSAAIKGARNQRASITSQAELNQHRTQRQNVSEEMDLDEKKRSSSLSPLRTVSEGAGLVRGILGGY